MHPYNRAINAALMGWFLNLAAFVFNLAQGGKLGVSLVLASFVCGYFGEVFAVNGVPERFINRLFIGAVAFTASSYLVWLMG